MKAMKMSVALGTIKPVLAAAIRTDTHGRARRTVPWHTMPTDCVPAGSNGSSPAATRSRQAVCFRYTVAPEFPRYGE